MRAVDVGLKRMRKCCSWRVELGAKVISWKFRDFADEPFSHYGGNGSMSSRLWFVCMMMVVWRRVVVVMVRDRSSTRLYGSDKRLEVAEIGRARTP